MIMSQRVRAIYQNGAFIPLEPFDLPEDSEVELTIRSPYVIAPKLTESSERAAVLHEIVRNMQANPLPVDALSMTREELHERR
jgi:predicted DNA-binding antitoxin AbrB/MazE fold protein